MKNLILTIISVFILSYSLIAQTIITGMVTDSLNNPIPFATVCLLKTTIGTSTDINGQYSLKIPQQGYYQLFASSVGYHSAEQNINADGNRQNIDLKLTVNYLKLNEVTVKSSDEYKKKYYTQFFKQFIGDTHNSLSCTILNPEDLHLYKDSKNDILKGFSLKPLRIENKALGYTVIYDLTDFSYNLKSEIFKFTGNAYFQPLESSANKYKKWEKNRLVAYYGSRMHFLRSLFADSLSKEYYKIFEDDETSSNIDDHLDVVLQRKDLVFPHNQISKKFFYRRPVLVIFTNNHPELEFSPYGFVADEHKTLLTFTDSVNINQNGMFDNPYSITWDGAMVKERIADMLPFDYQPYGTENMLSANRNNFKDQVFVHTDRNLYYPGDTVFFQAYIRNRLNGEFESGSTSMYALLFNDQKQIADSSRFKVENALSTGWMLIPDTAKSGKYNFVVFTSQMQNFDPGEAFQTQLKVGAKYSKPETKIAVTFNKESYLSGDSIEAIVKVTDDKNRPFRNRNLLCNLKLGKSLIALPESAKNKKGEYVLKFMVPDSISELAQLQLVVNETNNKSTTKNFNIPFNNQFINFSILPEGGTLAEGLEQKIGFNATNLKGEPVYIEGLLKAKNGWLVDSIKSGKYGSGSIVTVPEKDMYIELTNSPYKNKKYPLPEFNSSGKCMSIKLVNNRSFSIDVQSNDYNKDSVFITGEMNLKRIFKQGLKLDEMKRLIVDTDTLPEGAMLVRLFNNKMEALAERLVYINPDKHLKFNIQTDTSVYNPGQETELTISVAGYEAYPGQGIFSISAVDAASGNDPGISNPEINYIFNYHPYFAHNLPAKVLAEGIENLKDEQRDLLMMVYGWSKIIPDKRPKDLIHKKIINYDLLNMKILYSLKFRESDRKIVMISLEDFSSKYLLSDSKGEISLPLDSLSDETCSIIILPDEKKKRAVEQNNLLYFIKKKTVLGVKLDISTDSLYFRSDKLFKEMPIIPKEDFINSKFSYRISAGDSITQLPEVAISENAKRQYNDEYEKMFHSSYTLSLANETLWNMPSMFAAVSKLCPMAMTTSTDHVILNRFQSYYPATVVLDGVTLDLEFGWSVASKIHPDKLKSLTILLEGSGVIFVNTLLHEHDPKLEQQYTEWRSKTNTDNLLVPYKIYRPYREFYNPGKAEANTNPLLQERPTVFWKSEVYFDGKEPVKIKYPNLKKQGTVIISINGISENKLSGSGKAIYQVENKMD